MLEAFVNEFRRYRVIVEKALAQVPDDALNQVPIAEGNSMAMLVRHLSGNLVSRFTDFRTSDGEKLWRNRDGEFEERLYSRAEVNQMWQQGWSVLEEALSELSEADLGSKVRIRGLELTVQAALARSLAHVAYHVGQIVLLARTSAADPWDWISIPKGGSAQYNKNPTKEREIADSATVGKLRNRLAQREAERLDESPAAAVRPNAMGVDRRQCFGHRDQTHLR